MDRMISINHETINRQVGNLQDKDIIYCWKPYKFRSIKISGNRNRCLQYYLNPFYYDIDGLKKGPFFGQLCIGVNMQYVVRMIMRLFLTGC